MVFVEIRRASIDNALGGGDHLTPRFKKYVR